MKQYKAVVFVLAASMLLAGCKKSSAGNDFGRVVEDWRNGINSESTETSIVKYDVPEFGDTLGFDVVAYPDHRGLIPDKYFAIDNWFGQLEFLTVDDRTLVVRVADAENKSLELSYEEYHGLDKETRKVGEIEIKMQRSMDNCYLVSWEKDDFQYVIHSNKFQVKPAESEIDELVSTLETVKT